MPTYDYECQECGHRFEQLQNVKDGPLKTCLECGGSAQRSLGTGAVVIVKKARASTAPICLREGVLKEMCCA